jgi:hypothetical protein
MISKNNAQELKKLYDFNEQFDIRTNGLGPVPDNLKGSLVGEAKKMMLQNTNIQNFLSRLEIWLEKEDEEVDSVSQNDFNNIIEKSPIILEKLTEKITETNEILKSAFYDDSNLHLTEDTEGD